MSFALNPYTAPDFHREPLAGAPDAVLLPAPKTAWRQKATTR